MFLQDGAAPLPNGSDMECFDFVIPMLFVSSCEMVRFLIDLLCVEEATGLRNVSFLIFYEFESSPALLSLRK